MLSLTSLFKHTYQNVKVGGQRLGLQGIIQVINLGVGFHVSITL